MEGKEHKRLYYVQGKRRNAAKEMNEEQRVRRMERRASMHIISFSLHSSHRRPTCGLQNEGASQGGGS